MGQVHDERVEARPPFGREDGRHGLGVSRIGSEAIDGLGRHNHEAAVAQAVRGGFDGIRRGLQNGQRCSFWYLKPRCLRHTGVVGQMGPGAQLQPRRSPHGAAPRLPCRTGSVPARCRGEGAREMRCGGRDGAQGRVSARCRARPLGASQARAGATHQSRQRGPDAHMRCPDRQPDAVPGRFDGCRHRVRGGLHAGAGAAGRRLRQRDR